MEKKPTTTATTRKKESAKSDLWKVLQTHELKVAEVLQAIARGEQ